MSKLNVPYSKIANKLGISTATVSRALTHPNLVKDTTLLQIYNAIKESGGSLPERVSINSMPTRILAIDPILNNPFYTDLVQGMQDAADSSGCELLILNESLSESNIKNVLKLITQATISGVIVMQKLEVSLLNQLNAQTNVIQCSEFNEKSNVPYITIDNIAATKKIMNYLLAKGCRKIALVNNDATQYTYAQLRYQGYRDSLTEAGITIDPSFIITIPNGKFSNTVSAVSSMLERGNIPDAIFCVSDIMAAATLRACSLDGYKVPTDIMVTGFDNVDISVMTTPNITTINQPRRDMGFMAYTQLLGFLHNPVKETQRFVLDTELVVRESTGY